MTLDCAFAILGDPEEACEEDATIIVGGFSLCEEHRGDWADVATAFYEQITVEDLERMAAAMSPLARAFYDLGNPTPPPGTIGAPTPVNEPRQRETGGEVRET